LWNYLHFFNGIPNVVWVLEMYAKTIGLTV